MVTVLFAEVTPSVPEFSSKEPIDVVRSVNDIYSMLDTITDKYDVFKVNYYQYVSFFYNFQVKHKVLTKLNYDIKSALAKIVLFMKSSNF